MEPTAKRRRGRKIILILAAVLLGSAALAWVRRDALCARYYAWRIDRAAAEDRAEWVEALAGLGDAGRPLLLDYLRRDDPQLPSAAATALEKQADGFTPGDGRLAALAKALAEGFADFSPPGQTAALDLASRWAAASDPAVTQPCHEMVVAGLQQSHPETRVQAVGAALRPEVNRLDAVVPLLHDPAAEVRRAAMLALGPARETGPDPLVGVEELLTWLHDPDAEVRRICEQSLRSRGLGPKDVKLGRLLTDPKPQARLELLVHLPGDPELDLGLWLQRLSLDPVPAVRAGVARTAAEQAIDLGDRLEQMARNDPAPSVRQLLSDFYLHPTARTRRGNLIPVAWQIPR
jgi:hypothetical protein